MAQQVQSGTCEPPKGTIKPKCPFNPEEDSRKLREAMKGLGTNERVIIEILAGASNSQRQELKSKFKQLFGRDLVNDLKCELSGDFEHLVEGLMMPPREYDAYCLYKAMKGLGTTESTLIEILVTRSNAEIEEIKTIYQKKYGCTLESDIKGDTSSDFKRLMVSLANGHRDEDGPTNNALAVGDAERLRKAGIAKIGTDEEMFNTIMASRSFAQLRVTFNAYEKLADEEISKSIKKEFSGDIEDALLAIVDVARNIYEYFAKQLHRSMAGIGTDDTTLIRVIVSRSEVDLTNIKRAYWCLYNTELSADVKGDTSGDYRKLLVDLVEGF